MVKALWNVHPDVLTWGAVGFALLSAVLLYNAYDRPWMAVAAVPCLMGRLILHELSPLLSAQKGGPTPTAQLLYELSNRFSDVAIFLSFAFWPDINLRLVLLATIAMLVVSHVGVLGKAVGAKRVTAGVLNLPVRMILLMVACLGYGIWPDATIMGFGIFETLFVLFIPLASLALLQRLNTIFHEMPR